MMTLMKSKIFLLLLINIINIIVVVYRGIVTSNKIIGTVTTDI